ncbi:MAG: hypothetical protein GY895_04265 [Phycisphaera sp.]|nr:hypothetical protein [Phycisphaera sp.]
MPSIEPGEQSIRTVAALAESLADPDLAAIIAVEEPEPDRGRGLPRSVVAAYVEGRAALASGDPQAAIGPLERAAQLGGGAPALAALALALDESGRSADAFAIRREMARRGWMTPVRRARLVEDLLRRGASNDAIAVASAGVLVAEDATDRARAALLLDVTLEFAGRIGVGSLLRSLMITDRGIDLERAAFVVPGAVARFRRSIGDEAARNDDVREAAKQWRLASEIDPGLELGADRLIWSALGLRRDALVQVILLDAVDRQDPDLDAAIELALESRIDLSILVELLADRLESNPERIEVAGMLASLDPEAANEVFLRITAEGDSIPIAGALVDAAGAGGAASAWAVAAGFGETSSSTDVVVERLLAGPWGFRVLHEGMMEGIADDSSPASEGSRIVAAEVLRRHARLDLADAMLDGMEGSSPVERIVRIRIAGDQQDPLRILGVEEAPFDSRVEAERASGLLLVGEPELALQVTDEALVTAPDSGPLHAVRGRVLASFRDAGIEAWTEFRSAWALGERDANTCLELARLSMVEEIRSQIEDSVLDRVQRELLADVAFRRVHDADGLVASRNFIEAERLLEPLLEDPSWRSPAMARLLSIWRASGRLPEGRRRLEQLVEELPADPVVADALHAVVRAIDGSRAMAIDLRERSAADVSGHSRRRLEMVLAEIPESRREWMSVAGERIDGLPDGVARDMQILELALAGVDEEIADEIVDIVAGFEPESLTPRLRRRMVSVAAALPNGIGRPVIERAGSWHRSSGVPVDVDSALAMIHVMGPVEGGRLLEGLVAAPPITTLDSDWAERLLAPDFVGSIPIESSAAALGFAVGSLEPTTASAGIVRAAVAASIVAGATGASILELLEIAEERGWSLADAWGLEEQESALDLPLLAVSSDASLLGGQEVSLRLLEEAVDRDPLDAVALNNLGFALLEFGRVDEAATHIEASLDLDPASPSTTDSMGWLRYFQGRHDPEDEDGSLAWITKSVEARVQARRRLSSEVLLHLGDAAWRSGRETQAIQAWRTLLEGGSSGVSDRRLATLDAYQVEFWGGVLVPSMELEQRLEGRFMESARRRLESVAEGLDPATTPIPSEPELDSGVQDPDG